MAIDPSARYPGQIDTSDPTGYPRGKARNVGVPGDGTGTPWEQDLVNDIFGFQQDLLDRASATPTGTPEKKGASQYADAIQSMIDTTVATEVGALADIVDATTDLSPQPARTIIFHPSIFRPFKISGAGGNAQMPVAAAGTGFRVSVPDANSGLMCQLNGLLPFGAGVTQIDLLIKPSTKGSPGRFSVNAAQPDFSTPAIGSHSEIAGANTDGTTNLQVLSLTTGFAIGATFFHYLAYNPVSVTAGADLLEAVRIQFDDPGPRNF